MEEFSVTFYNSSAKVKVPGQVIDYDNFREFAELFSKCQKGTKDSGYFIRGGVNRTSDLFRNDHNLPDARLVVLDADSGENGGNPSEAATAHSVLSYLGYKHFIYTTHSNKIDGKIRWRAVLLADRPFVKGELSAAVKYVSNQIRKEGVNIGDAKEQYRWSQPWFVPKRTDPNDGGFEYYYSDGSCLNIDAAISYGGKGSDNSDNSSYSGTNSGQGEYVGESEKTNERMVDEIIGGVEYHENILNLTYQYCKQGLTKSLVLATIRGIMNACIVKDKRWKERYDDLERVVDGAIRKLNEEIEEESSVDFDYSGMEDWESKEESARIEVPTAPGLLGDLIQDAYDMAYYQYKEVATVSALGCLCGIVGRKFNIAGTGLNMYMTLIMGTGMGKDSIHNFVHHTMNQLIDTDSIVSSFIGPSRFTGPAGVIKSLENARSQVCILTEAGLLLQSEAGDKAGLKRVLLSLFSKSGYGCYSGAEHYSKNENHLKSLHSPALSIVNEATPETLLKAFGADNSLETGELPRQLILRVGGNKPYMNRRRIGAVRGSVLEKLRHLHRKCAEIQSKHDYQVFSMLPCDEAMAKDWEKHENMCVDLENSYRSTDPVKQIMASRMHVKTLKLAALASCFNHFELNIRWEDWEWAKQFTEWEYSGVDHFFKGSGMQSDVDLLCYDIIPKLIVKVLSGFYSDRRLRCRNATEQAKGIFPIGAIRMALKNNRVWKDFENSNRGGAKTYALMNLLNMMCDEGLLVKPNMRVSQLGNKEIEDRIRGGGPTGRGCTVLYKITKEFDALVSKGAL